MNDRSGRIVITGRGTISPIGQDVETFWDNLTAGNSGVEQVTLFDASDFPTTIAAEVKEWDPTPWIDFKAARRMSRSAQFGIAAAQQAVDDAALTPRDFEDDGIGIFLGTGIGGWEVGYEAMKAFHLSNRGWKGINPFQLPETLPNMPAYHIAERFGVLGHLSTHISACATGTQAVVEAAEVIRRGWAHTIITGATEAEINEIAFAGYSRMRGMSTRNHDPHGAVRPFDQARDGFLMGEGAAIFVIEALEHALARGATIYGEILSGASSSDAYHIAQPHPEGAGAIRSIRLAAERSGVELSQIDYINPHGPGTPLGDTVEVHVLKTVFGEGIYDIPVSSTKSMIGHSMGAAGAFEALATLKTLESQTIHPTINCTDPEPGFDLDFVTEGARPARVEIAMSNNIGLGGQNASLVLKRWNGSSNGAH